MLIYGRNPVLEAIREGQVGQVWVARGVERWLLQELERLGAAYRVVPRVELDQMVRTTQHQGLVAELESLAYADAEAPFRRAEERGELPLLVLLDGITDPRNYGALIRSAFALGAHGVVTEARRSAPLTALVLKASAGAARRIPLVQVKNLPRYLEELKGRGLWIYGTSGRASRTLGELDYRRPLAVVVGSEGEGMRRLVAERCDELLRIPLVEGAESLNAAVALGVVLYQVGLARGAPGLR
ncbi:MAG: 23S rRNA (guanosine(2251)-2'-O)-methyltransferase RlmB [Meiothermus sp.]|uniref:23S rRNA (guanosine(2251)-2'-O)-methyltransferase RlmB n=1 Tax=Meiothermus sp. TaxID=1955249 RepID=UPI00262C2BFE|nr:23S rRNA (guanosine(2251)-2'-O)-methyltransferase RlmB [Meiothermus sp.]MCS7058148.1 23S rRNA (guanosine(2251)-2'-O)-methyltransferase RlmB [Meiothermus sp.]MCX7741135.1 23S rRNA (guanosine(2251)-2'-O)-methyltransferase RlmB [Meiothermus sp.]MDW8481983.1 23S rRNA (guanosine(2251)-2'-O)-methyltransferase RlmB [Meiothermus sp.]